MTQSTSTPPEIKLSLTRLLSVWASLAIVLSATGFLWEVVAAGSAGVALDARVLSTYFEASCFAAWVVSLASLIWLVVAFSLQTRVARGVLHWGHLILLTSPLIWLGVGWIRTLFGGSRVAGHWFAVAAEVAIEIMFVALAVMLARRIMTALVGGRASIRVYGLWILGAVFFAGADQAFFVRRYVPFHHLAVFCASGLLVAALLPSAYAFVVAKRPSRIAQFVLVVVSLFFAVRYLSQREIPAELIGWADRSPIWGRAHALHSRNWTATTPPTMEGSVLYSSGRVPDGTLDALMPQRQQFNVLWITIDALRADHVSGLGYHRPTTPHLDALARESVMFRRAISQSPSSPLSFASMFTGRYPRGLRPDWSPEGKLSLAPTRRFAESMLEAGVATMGILALEPAMQSRIFPDLERGFEKFVVAPEGHTYSSGEVADLAATMLQENGTKRWMMWAHFFDPHMPYRPNPNKSFGTTSADLYDGEIAAADASLGRLLDGLRQRPDWDRTIVVVQSDHGEEFGDHGGAFHGSSLYQEQVWVPLVLRVPGIAARQVESRVQLVDIVPTLHRILRLPVPGNLHGRSLMRHMIPTPGVNPVPNVAVAQLDRGGNTGFDHAVWIDNFKMIHDVRLNLAQWFDLDADPGERRATTRVPVMTESMAHGAIAEVEALCRGTQGARDDEQSLQRNVVPADEAAVDAMMLKLELSDDRPGLRACVREVLASGPSTAVKQNCLLKSFAAGGLIDDDQIRELLRDPIADVRVSAGIDVVGRAQAVDSEITDLLIHDADPRARALGWTSRLTTSETQAHTELGRLLAATDSVEARLIAVAGLAAANKEPWVGLIAPVTNRDEIPIGASIALMLAVAKLMDPWFTIECADDLQAREGGYVRSRLASRALFPMVHRLGVGSLRRFVTNGDPLVRRSGERVLLDLGRAASRDGIRATQDAMTASVGISERSAASGVKALEAAFLRSVAAEVADAVPLMRAWRLLLLEKQFDEARRLMLAGSKASALPPDLPAVLERLSKVAELAGNPIIVKQATMTGDRDVRADGTWLGVLHVTLDERSGSLIGGREAPAAAIALSVRAMDGIGDERPVLFPLSLRGVLPGETVSLLLFHTAPFNAASVTTLRVGLINPATNQVLPQLTETRVSKAP